MMWLILEEEGMFVELEHIQNIQQEQVFVPMIFMKKYPFEVVRCLHVVCGDICREAARRIYRYIIDYTCIGTCNILLYFSNLLKL